MFHGRADAATALGLHLALDLVVVSVWLIHALDRWARRRDDRQRRVLAAFLLVVLAITAVDGILEVMFRHGIDRDLLVLRTMILRRNRDNPFQVVAVVSPPPSTASAPRRRAGAGPFSEGPRPAAGSASSSGPRCLTCLSSTSATSPTSSTSPTASASSSSPAPINASPAPSFPSSAWRPSTPDVPASSTPTPPPAVIRR